MLRTKASLRIIGDLDLSMISEELDIIPSFTCRKGDKGPLGEVMTSDIWIVDYPHWEEDSVQKQLRWLIRKFENKREILERKAAHAKIDVFLGITSADQSGFSLSHEELTFFCKSKIDLEISLTS
ncbi:MAG TPA: DUF4279 domain-containing protein [Aridibacter sp.]|nr:DUF4279 domain-containing protein [Aridibacter sp.]